jgi:hypothetical protein
MLRGVHLSGMLMGQRLMGSVVREESMMRLLDGRGGAGNQLGAVVRNLGQHCGTTLLF